MNENIWDKSKEEMQFKQENRDVKLWNLDEREFNLHNLHIWIEAEYIQKLNCSYSVSEGRNKLRNISTHQNLTSNENTKNKNAFDDFIKTNLDNPKFKNKFVAFVNGKFQDIGDKRNALIEKMYNEFGNVDMYVDKVTDQRKVILIDTPKFN